MNNLLKLKIDLLSALENELGKIGKEMRWLKFARKNKNGGYQFLDNKEKQWQVLEKIAKKVSTKYIQFTYGQIVDILSELVNNQ